MQIYAVLLQNNADASAEQQVKNSVIFHQKALLGQK